MKKFLFTIAFLSYLFAATGVVVNTHYCMKKLVSVKLFGGESVVCEKCGMDKHQFSECCHDEMKVVKLQQDQDKFTPLNYKIIVPEQTSAVISVYIVSPFLNQNNTINSIVHQPPLISEQDNYLKHKVFRI